MKTKSLRFVLYALLPSAALATDFYWSSIAPQPASWNDLSSWKVGGDSQWDPDATTFPIPSDTIFFRGVQATVTADADSDNTFGTLRLQNEASVTFAPPASARFQGNFIETSANSAFSFLSGTFYMADREFYAGSPANLTFSGPSTHLIGRDPTSGSPNHYLQFQVFAHDGTIRFLDGVKGSAVRVNLSPFDNNGYNNTLLISGSGTTLNDFIIGGRSYNSTIRIEDGATINDLKLNYTENVTPDIAITSNLFYTANATIHNFRLEREYAQLPNPVFHFDSGSTITMPAWDGHSLIGPNALLRLAGPYTTFSNFTVRVAAPNATVEVVDGATPTSRWFLLGYGRTDQTARIAGPETIWTIAPNDMDLEGVFYVGMEDGGRPGSHNTLLIEDGATLNIISNYSFKGSSPKINLTGLYIGKEPGDDHNHVIVRNGATVNNAFWTGIGGSFINSRGDGGAFNTLTISNATYHGGTSYNDVWDATLYIGGMNGYSNTFEVVDGSLATFTGCARLARYNRSGGNTLRVRNSTLTVASRITHNCDSLDYGSCNVEIAGTNGTITASALEIEGYKGSDPTLLTLTIAETGRSIPDPFLTLTSKIDKFDSPFAIGAIQLRLDIDRIWGESGSQNIIPLISVANNPGNPSTCEYSLNQLAASIPTDNLGGCKTSVAYDPASDAWVLSLTAGNSPGTVLILR